MSLDQYRRKRDFEVTSEPEGESKSKASAKSLSFVVQKHQASHLHYDFRLEWNGVLLSWAVPKGPSLDPSVKRLAMAVEDHPVEYGGFEGTIPEGQYGGGTVMLWDNGTWEPDDPDVDASLQKGELKFSLQGHKLKGSWVLVRTRPKGGRASWLLIKHRDKFASDSDITAEKPRSVVSKRLMAVSRRVQAATSPKPPPVIPLRPRRKLVMPDSASASSLRKAKAPPEAPGAQLYVPEHPTLPVLREAVQQCQGCDLYLKATQAVFGEGTRSAPLLFIGEQPGDEEDRNGRPFVGPAGRLLDRAFEEAGIDRSAAYVTNVVKHFKFEERGKRRIHQKPNSLEIRACRPWLEAELAIVKPDVLVCLGATAAQAVFGSAYRLTRERGLFVAHPWAKQATSTIHPSAILRAPDEEARQAEYQRLVDDLKKVNAALRAA